MTEALKKEDIKDQEVDLEEESKLEEGEMPPALKKALEKKGKLKSKKDDEDEDEEDEDEVKEGKYKMKKESVDEDINAIFSGEQLSEEFKSNAKAIFEAAVQARVNEQAEALEEEYNTKLQEEIASINENIIGKVDEYLDYVVSEWMEENKLAIDSGIKSEIVEDFMVGLKNLFVEHYIDIPEEKVDMVEELASKVEQLETELDKLVTENATYESEINSYKKEIIFDEVSEGLTDVQSAKLKSLAENIEFVSEEDYKEKVILTKKKYFEASSEEIVTESANPQAQDENAIEDTLTPVMEHYVKSISKTLKK